MSLRAPTIDTAALGALVQENQTRAKGLANAAYSGLSKFARENTPPPESDGQKGYASGLSQWGGVFADNVPGSLIRTESGGNPMARNNVEGAGGKGHFGLLQFSRARLQEAIAAGAIPQMTPEQFLQSTSAQVSAGNWHFADIDKYVKNQGLDRYLGQQINGVTLTPNGMRAVAHLGGKGGLSQFVNSGGNYNPADAYGTSLLAYARTHG